MVKIIVVYKIEHLNQEVTGPHWTDDIKDAQSDRTKVHSLTTRTQYSNFVFEEFKTQE